MSTIYGYCRISRKTQDINRQSRNIKSIYPDAVIVQEAYTGTSINRPLFDKLVKMLKPNDTVVFDSVSRMSRTAAEGFELYERLYNNSINLVFLKEPHINTATYKQVTQIDLVGDKVDYILEGVNKYLMELAKEQIRLAFEQSQKEVMDLRQRTKEGLITAKLNGKQIGAVKGSTFVVKKAESAKEIILKYSKDFGGSLEDSEVMLLAKCSRNSYYKYKKLLKDEQAC